MAGAGMHLWLEGSLIDSMGLYSVMYRKDKKMLQNVANNFSCEISTEY